MKSEPRVILLVEDEEAHAEIIRRNLEDCDFTSHLVHVEDGQFALDYLYQRNGFRPPAEVRRPDIILLDWNLPKLSGLEVLKTIKTDPLLKRIPVIILTTSSAEADISAAYEYHANSFLMKPMDYANFHQMLETLCAYWFAWNHYPIESEGSIS